MITSTPIPLSTGNSTRTKKTTRRSTRAKETFAELRKKLIEKNNTAKKVTIATPKTYPIILAFKKMHLTSERQLALVQQFKFLPTILPAIYHYMSAPAKKHLDRTNKFVSQLAGPLPTKAEKTLFDNLVGPQNLASSRDLTPKPNAVQLLWEIKAKKN